MKSLIKFAVVLFAVSVQAQTRTLTVEEAILRAKERAPERVRTEAMEQQAQGLQRSASSFFTERPELDVEYISERPFGERDYELSIGLSQEIPLAGVRGRREKLAAAVGNASEISRGALDRQIALRTRLVYNRAWSLSKQVELGNRLIIASNKLVEASDKRLAAGDMSTLDRNTIALEANRQRIAHERVHSLHDQAIGELEALTGLSLAGAELQADTIGADLTIADSSNLLYLSPDYARIISEIQIAQARLELARSEVFSNPTIGLHYSQDLLTIDGDQIEYREDAIRNITGITAPGRAAGLSLSVQVPISIPGIWGPNNTDVIERETDLRMLEAEKAALEIALTGKLARLKPQLRRIAIALQIYHESTILIEQNYELLDRGYEGGELSVTELLVGRQQLVELQTEQLELIQEMRQAEIELHSILGK